MHASSTHSIGIIPAAAFVDNPVDVELPFTGKINLICPAEDLLNQTGSNSDCMHTSSAMKVLLLNDFSSLNRLHIHPEDCPATQ